MRQEHVRSLRSAPAFLPQKPHSGTDSSATWLDLSQVRAYMGSSLRNVVLGLLGESNQQRGGDAMSDAGRFSSVYFRVMTPDGRNFILLEDVWFQRPESVGGEPLAGGVRT